MPSELAIGAAQSDRTSDDSFGNRLGRFRTRVAARLQLGVYAKLVRHGLCRNLERPIQQPVAEIPISVRPLQEDDLASLFAYGNEQSTSERKEIAWRLAFFEKGARRGFVAIDRRTGAPCHVEWIFGPDDNAFVERLKGFPSLQTHQALIENVYTPPPYRRLGIMSQAMAMISECAAEQGAREVFTFIPHDNIASLKGAQRAGFLPRMLHQSVRIGFGLIRTDKFDSLLKPDSISVSPAVDRNCPQDWARFIARHSLTG